MENETERIKTEVTESVNTADKYTQVLPLPSDGYFGGPKEITIRAMTTKEEKILYSTRDESFIKKIVKSCTIEPSSLDVGKLHPEDLVYILFSIRNLTFGPTYKQPTFCPFCGAKNFTEINITDFSYTSLDTTGIDGKLFIELPVSKDKVHLKLLSIQDSDNIDREVERLASKGSLKDPAGHNFFMRLCASVDSVEDKTFESDKDKQNYLNNLHARDVNAIRNRLNTFNLGMNTTFLTKCEACGEEYEVTGAYCPEFFRPTE